MQKQQRPAQDRGDDEAKERGRRAPGGRGRRRAGADLREDADEPRDADAAERRGTGREREHHRRVQGNGAGEGAAGGAGRAGREPVQEEGGCQGDLPERQGHHHGRHKPARIEREMQKRRRFRRQTGKYKAKKSGFSNFIFFLRVSINFFSLKMFMLPYIKDC